MPLKGQPPAVRRNLRAMLFDGAGYSLMVGVGETYIPAFVLAIGLGEVAAALVATIPMLCGAILQLISPAGVRWIGSPKKWVVLCVSCQAASFLPFVVAALMGRLPMWAVFAMATLYWAAGQSAGAAWTTWVGRIVPVEIRAQFFGLRTRVLQTGMLVGLLAAGLLLHAGETHPAGGLGIDGKSPTLVAFAIIFAGAALARTFSAGFLTRQHAASADLGTHRDVPLRELFGHIRHGGSGRLLFYLFSVQMAAQVAIPFFNPYLLKHLNVSYGQYAALTGALFGAKALFLPVFGRFAHRFGTSRLLWTGGIAILPQGLLWMVSTDFWFLMSVQFVCGAAWAAYELASLLLFFEAIDETERTSVVTTYNLANSLAIASGSLLGAGLLNFFGGQQTAYFVLFAASTVLRVLTLPVLRHAAVKPSEPLPEAEWQAMDAVASKDMQV